MSENQEVKEELTGMNTAEEFEKAIENAKKFHPVGKMYVNGYTGEVSQFKTPANYVPDEGVACGKPDLCHTEDYVSIADMYKRLAVMKALSIQDSDFDYFDEEVSADDLDETTLSDVVSEVDDPGDYKNIVEPFAESLYGAASEQPANDSAGQKQAEERANNDEPTLGGEEA